MREAGQRERGREIPSADSLLKWPVWLGQAQAEARNQELREMGCSPYSAAFLGVLVRSLVGSGGARSETAHLWDTVTADSLICYTTTPAPPMVLIK